MNAHLHPDGGPIQGPLSRAQTPMMSPALRHKTSTKRIGDAFDRLFSKGNRRRRESLFPTEIAISYPTKIPAPPPIPDSQPRSLQRLATRSTPDMSSLKKRHESVREPLPQETDFDWMQSLSDDLSAQAKRRSDKVALDRQDSDTLEGSGPKTSIRTQFAQPLKIQPEAIVLQPAPLKHALRTGGRAIPALHEAFVALELPEEKPMASLKLALIFVLQNEGSTFVNDPVDRGGPTRFGVTQKTLSQYLGRAASVEDVQAITQDTVSEVYRRYYWKPIGGDDIKDQYLATALMDLSVLCGPATAVRMIQAVLKVEPDGCMGPLTLKALNLADPVKTLHTLSQKACTYFSAIALRDATQVKWLPGWQLRAHRMLAQDHMTA